MFSDKEHRDFSRRLDEFMAEQGIDLPAEDNRLAKHSRFTPDEQRRNLEHLRDFLRNPPEGLLGFFSMTTIGSIIKKEYEELFDTPKTQTLPSFNYNQNHYDRDGLIYSSDLYSGQWGATEEEVKPSSYTCGSVCCAVGWAPFATGICKPRGLDWSIYAQQAFGIEDVAYSEDFIFGAIWDNIDNTAKGAAERIDYYLENDRYPHGYLEYLENRGCDAQNLVREGDYSQLFAEMDEFCCADDDDDWED